MLQPQNRFPTLVLAAGALVLVLAIVVGERMGTRVLGQATEQSGQTAAVDVTPEPQADQTVGPYGPGWQRSETLSAAGDPGFPDPRIPPKPLPTAPPAPVATPTPVATATPFTNPNIPIWRQQPLPTVNPSASPGASQSAEPAATPPADGVSATPSPS